MIKVKLNKLSLPLKASIAFMIGNILNQMINLVSTPIFTRVLSENDYGVINVYQSWFSILSIILTLSLTGATYNNAMVDYKDNINEFTSTLLILLTIILSFFGCINIVFSDQVSLMIGLPKTLCNILVIHIFCVSVINIWLAQERFNYRYKLSIVINFATAFIGVISSYFIVGILEEYKAIGKVIGVLIGVVPSGVILYLIILIKGKKFIDTYYWKYSLKNSIPMIPHYLSNVVLAQSDRILINNIIGSAEAGMYGVAYSAASVINIIWNAINASWLPWTFQKMKEGNYKDIKKVSNILVIFASIMSFVFILFAPEVIKILAAPTYYEAVVVMPPVIIGTFFIFIYTLFGNIELYHKKTNLIMIGSLIAAFINIVLNVVFIPVFGYVAAAYTTLVGYILLSIMHYKLMRKVDDNDIYDIKCISICSILITILGVSIGYIYKCNIIRYSIIIIILIIIMFYRKFISLFIKSLFRELI